MDKEKQYLEALKQQELIGQKLLQARKDNAPQEIKDECRKQMDETNKKVRIIHNQLNKMTQGFYDIIDK